MFLGAGSTSRWPQVLSRCATERGGLWYRVTVGPSVVQAISSSFTSRWPRRSPGALQRGVGCGGHSDNKPCITSGFRLQFHFEVTQVQSQGTSWEGGSRGQDNVEVGFSPSVSIFLLVSIAPMRVNVFSLLSLSAYCTIGRWDHCVEKPGQLLPINTSFLRQLTRA
jgi:hypothetical protein